MIRYRTRDLTRIISEPCACGRTHRKIDKLIGRTDDMLIIRGVNVFPSQIEQCITDVEEVVPHYQIILTNDDGQGLEKVQLDVECDPSFRINDDIELSRVKKELAAGLKSNLQIAVVLNIVPSGTIVRSEGKAKRVLDLRKNLH